MDTDIIKKNYIGSYDIKLVGRSQANGALNSWEAD